MIQRNLFHFFVNFFTGECPHPTRLSCINLLYSYPCVSNDACALRGMDCCPTSCSYGPNMCVPKGIQIHKSFLDESSSLQQKCKTKLEIFYRPPQIAYREWHIENQVLRIACGNHVFSTRIGDRVLKMAYRDRMLIIVFRAWQIENCLSCLAY